MAGLEEALHVCQLEAVAVALQLLDLHVVASCSILRVLQLVAAVGRGLKRTTARSVG